MNFLDLAQLINFVLFVIITTDNFEIQRSLQRLCCTFYS